MVAGMSETQTTTPIRDELIAVLETLIEDAHDSLDGFCADCRDVAEDRCSDHAPFQVRVDRYEPAVLKLWQARTDTEAIALAAGLGEPAVAALVARQTGMDERAVTDLLAVAAGAEQAA
jgi:hypothetical protein